MVAEIGRVPWILAASLLLVAIYLGAPVASVPEPPSTSPQQEVQAIGIASFEAPPLAFAALEHEAVPLAHPLPGHHIPAAARILAFGNEGDFAPGEPAAERSFLRIHEERLEEPVEWPPAEFKNLRRVCIRPPTPPPAPEGSPFPLPPIPAGDVEAYALVDDANGTRDDVVLFVARAAVAAVGLTKSVAPSKGAQDGPGGDVAARAGATVRRWFRKILALVGATKWISRSNALDLGTRRRILAQLEVAPGSHAGQLADALGLRRQTLIYHLRVLESLGFVASRSRAKVHYFRVEQVRMADPRGFLGATARRVLGELEAGVRTKRELVERLRLTRRGIAWHLRRLAADGLVRIEQAGRAKAYVPSTPSSASGLLRPDVAKDALGVA